MGIQESLQKRRSYYAINNVLPVSEEEIERTVQTLTELVPDAFNMKSARVVLAFGRAHEQLWDNIFDAFHGKVPRKKIDSFRAGAGTVLYFYDEETVRAMQSQFAAYADNFPLWALQANGMLQLSIWSGLRELGVGASVQHYNPVIDDAVRAQFDVPEGYRLIAQMPFGSIVEEPEAKEREEIARRVKIVR